MNQSCHSCKILGLGNICFDNVYNHYQPLESFISDDTFMFMYEMRFLWPPWVVRVENFEPWDSDSGQLLQLCLQTLTVRFVRMARLMNCLTPQLISFINEFILRMILKFFLEILNQRL